MSGASGPDTTAAFTITPMPGPFGATIGGLDATRPLTPAASAALAAALFEHRVLSVVDQHLDHAAYTRFGRAFGNPISFFNPKDRHQQFPELIRITNSASTPERLRNGAMHWHQDSTYEAVPAAVTMLLALEAPASANDTLFADMVAAYDALPTAVKDRIDDLHVIHDPRGGHEKLSFDGERRGDSGRAAAQVTLVTHPLVIRHPATGRAALYGISGTAAGIEGMDLDTAVALLAELKRHALADRFRQTARADVGTILIWDNLAVMHCATPTAYSDADCERRLLYRISTRAEGSLR